MVNHKALFPELKSDGDGRHVLDIIPELLTDWKQGTVVDGSFSEFS